VTTRPLDLEAPQAGEPGWLEPLRQSLKRTPDPERARELADRVLEASPASVLETLDTSPTQAVGAIFLALCGVAPFFAPFLIRHSHWLAELAAEDYSRVLTRKELEARLDSLLVREPGAVGCEAARLVLRRFKYYELARITVRDCWREALPLERSAETLAELSCLADVLLHRSLAIAAEKAAQRNGDPRWRSGEDAGAREISLGFCVLGLGKLGSEELNYSSDVDLIYVHESPPDSVSNAGDGATSLTPTEYFTRLGQIFGGLVSESTAEGFLYRIDLDLRPEGAQGNLVISEAALAHYYEVWADTWEKAAFMKARPVAGDDALGWRTIRSLDPLIYRSTMDYAGVQAIKSLKSKIEEAHGRSDTGFNVKIDSGGIRDIEFIAQSMQLLHGGRIPQVRARSTQEALDRLAGVEILPHDEVTKLLEAYRLLRRVENRLQMQAERQTHVLPDDPDSLNLLARAMGDPVLESGEELRELLSHQRRLVLDFFESFFVDEGIDRIFELFCRNVPALVRIEPSRSMIQRLSERFAREIGASPDAERALNNLDRFIQSIGRYPFYYELLLDRPELVPRLTAMFAASKYLSNVLASHPKLIEPVFEDPAVLIPSREAMRADLTALVAADPGSEDETEKRLDAVRLFKNRQVVNAGLLDIGGKIERAEVEQALTNIAETCIDFALDFAGDWLERQRGVVPEAARAGTFLIVGMGKLASRELSYGSDLDVIFLFDTATDEVGDVLEAQDYFVRLAQRFISILQTSTGEGSCYEIDARLRPSGNQGLLVSSLASFRRYHQESAEAWERQALLRARPIVGGSDLASAFESLRREILRRDLPAELAAEIHRIRQRMEDELARETPGRRDFKTGRGGVLDVETAVQYLQLKHIRECEELLEVDRIEVQLERLNALGHLHAGAFDALVQGWDFLQRLGNRLRIVENRSISDLDEERGDLEGLARRLGYESTGREGGARRALLQDYHHHTEAIRATYLELLQAED